MRIGLVVSGAQCRRRQWLEVNSPVEGRNLRASTTNSRRLREAIRGSVSGRFDEVFEAEGIRVRADLLEELDGGLGLRRFRAATRRRPWHVDELALQVHVLRACGLRVVSAQLWRLNRRYRRGSELDVMAALKRLEVIDQVDARLEAWIERLPELAVLPAEEPEIEAGPHCTRPRQCPFRERCGWVPRALEPSPLTERIDRARVTGAPVVDASLAEDLRAEGTVHALDFEAWAPALPAFPGTAPFESVVVQWSLHTRNASGLVHREGFMEPHSDGRRALVEALFDALEEPGPIYVFSEFEGRALGRMREMMSAHAERLEAIRARLVDLLPLLREKYVHPDFDGAFGLKRVLPVLVPGEGYEDLDLDDGGEAALAYGELADPSTTGPRRQQIREMLSAYCARDSWALLRIREALLAKLGVGFEPC
ncbi:MAG TPA: DUF2779 domain-containing protein [Myxococcota bacterium]|nr:DUF2779 domain-containing protein [Myxococcota bacterium]